MATYTDQLVVLDSGIVTKIAASDIIEIGGSFIIGGDLTISGTTTTVDSINTSYADNHLYLNNGYTTTAAETGGLVVNYLPTSNVLTTSGAGVITVPGDIEITLSGATADVLTAGMFVQISGASLPENNGIFKVVSNNTTSLLVLETTLAADEDFLQSTMTATTDTGMTITNVGLSILRAGTDGAWESASGSSSPLTFADLATSAGSTLQSAYDVGATITTASTTDIAFTLSSGNFVVNGGGQADFGISGTDLTAFGVGTGTFNVDATGAVTIDSTGAGISLDAAGASNFSTSSGNLNLGSASNLLIGATGASGNVSVNSTNGDINIGNLANNGAINIGTNGTRTVTIGSGTADIVASSGTLDVPAGTNFKIGTTALTTANFTAANVDTLLDGSNADSLHNHGTVDVEFTADGSGITAGYMVYFSAAGVVTHADASAIGTARVAGWSASGITASTAGNISVSGKVTNATIESAGSLTIGSPVYLSETAGQVTATAPSSSGSAIMQVGIAYSTTEFIWQPQFIAVNP